MDPAKRPLFSSSVANNTPAGGLSHSVEPIATSPSTATIRVLNLVYVIENEHISSVITELIVKKNLFGGEVQRYPNGQQAFDELERALKAGATLPDLIVLDLDMPLMDGWEFLDALAGLGLSRPIQVFVLTSSIDPADQAKALANGSITGFFTKPLKKEGVEHMYALLQEG